MTHRHALMHWPIRPLVLFGSKGRLRLDEGKVDTLMQKETR